MPRTVQDIMNRELLSVRPDLPAREARELLCRFQIGAAPVVDDARRPVGVVALRDLLDDGGSVGERMSRPAVCVAMSATVEQGARQLAEMNLHHVVVVDGTGAAVGMLSTLDALRALLDLPARHPATFPHWDEATGRSWSDEWPLDGYAPSHVPESPGVWVLSVDRLGERDTVLWVAGAENLRESIRRLVSSPASEAKELHDLVSTPGARLRATVVPDAATREHIVGLLRSRMAFAPAPGSS
jgi:CBS domain-containing protein